ncbi:glycine cleavage H-protein [Besnoitia besnoiti]|uniref:Glycine cleavage H-protein n=1 Tax=Besnoitia besnoiti TaxID=94643 RepID=A0A2A9M9K8_BESBE|nr:glycine cleavage H-protein [Besnoitia besnoiti]PFH34589.1 glycine cleavage H-protein [Besnoitia besnoiti]
MSRFVFSAHSSVQLLPFIWVRRPLSSAALLPRALRSRAQSRQLKQVCLHGACPVVPFSCGFPAPAGLSVPCLRFCRASSSSPTSASASLGSSADSAGSPPRPAPTPLGVYYSKSHEYVRFLLDAPEASAGASSAGAGPERVLFGIIGISAHAAEELGEVVYADFPQPIDRLAHAAPGDAAERPDSAEAQGDADGFWVKRGSPVCSLESVKSVAEVYSPVDGRVTAVNRTAVKTPNVIFQDPEGQGWILRLQLTSAADNGGDCGEEERAREVVAKLTKRLMDEERYCKFVEAEKHATSSED